MDKKGSIQLIIGPMFSGKSQQMFRQLRRYHHARKSCLVVNYIKEKEKTPPQLSSNNDKNPIKFMKATTINEIKNKALKYDIVAIDGAHFFPDIVEGAEQLANSGIMVIVSALDGSFQRKPYGNILSLIPMAEGVTKLTAVCIDCGSDAAFTRRITDSKQLEVIGGEQTYKPVCRECFRFPRSPEDIKTEKSVASDVGQ